MSGNKYQPYKNISFSNAMFLKKDKTKINIKLFGDVFYTLIPTVNQ